MSRVDNREFVVTYIRSESLESAAQTLGMTKAAVSARAVYLRKQGVKLPKMKRNSRTAKELEIAQLNSLIKKHTTEGR